MRHRWCFVLLLLACGGESRESPEVSAPPPQESATRDDEVAVTHPLHGLVVRPAVPVREAPEPESAVLGYVRWGERPRLRAPSDGPPRTRRCASGWYEVAPEGWLCSGQGVEVGEAPPESEASAEPADRAATLPYRYFFVKAPLTPEYHRLPTPQQQDAAQAFARRYLALKAEGKGRRAERMWNGEIAIEPQRPAVVARYLARGFYVAATELPSRGQRRFARTPGGAFVALASLDERTGAPALGVALDDEERLPIAWVRRSGCLRLHRDRFDGTLRTICDEGLPAVERPERLREWVRRENLQDRVYHRLERADWDEPRYLKSWFVGVAERTEPPFQVEADEPWVHVDLGEQTLVLYRGTEPVYATLVSTGLEGHATPTGVFRVHKKMLSDTMADLGPDAGDESYRIQDVPWTQYFAGSVALHAAFWHGRFGIERSHGCVNLAPGDAAKVFAGTWPELPDGWHGVVVARDARTSRVLVTN
ncbi:MAG: L,D-transpeptidase [Myxococcota bacterium]